MIDDLKPGSLLGAYVQGIFPMADEDGEIYWFSPDPRTIFDLDAFHVSRRLRSVYRQHRFALTVDRDFAGVMDGCADRPEGTWINDAIREAYLALHASGFAHSVEVWRGDTLAGGLYGVTIGGAFFAESMFHRVTDASKIALVYLVERLRACGFSLLDVQFKTPHLARFGCLEIPRSTYLTLLDHAILLPRRFTEESGGSPVQTN